MNVILLAPADFIDARRVRLTDARADHIRHILQAATGERIRVGALDGLLGHGAVLRADEQAVELEIALEQAPPPKLPLTIVLALPRPKMMRRIFRTVAELGVRELILINTYKVEKSYWQSPALAPATVRGYLLDGLQQARDTVLPAVRFERRFKPFVEDSLPTLAAATLGLVAHPGAGSPCPVGIDRACTLAIGPEGGFTPYEVEKLQQAGLQPVRLGERILRVENALTTLIGRLFT
jgi:RsmE family RNA methyltransferase